MEGNWDEQRTLKIRHISEPIKIGFVIFIENELLKNNFYFLDNTKLQCTYNVYCLLNYYIFLECFSYPTSPPTSQESHWVGSMCALLHLKFPAFKEGDPRGMR